MAMLHQSALNILATDYSMHRQLHSNLLSDSLFTLNASRRHLSLVPRATRAASIQLRGPPADFDHRSATEQATEEVVRSYFPDLLDLVEDGSLAVVRRASNYKERRTDGYQEPETIFVLGTSHFSAKSAEDAARVIQAVQPENVVLEVCRSRTAVMYDEPAADPAVTPGRGPANPMSLSGPSFGEALLRSVRLGGGTAVLLRAVLAAQASRAAEALGARSGVEMRAARRAAEAVGAQIVLGDRPIEITLQRAWDALTWRRRAELAAAALRSAATPVPALDAAAVEAMKGDDVITAVMRQMSGQYPELVAPLLHERDMYLAWSLKRSKAVDGTRRVMGVVGKGHVRGVLYALTHPSAGEGLRFRDLVGGKNVARERQRERRSATTRLLLELALAGGTYVAWSQLFP